MLLQLLGCRATCHRLLLLPGCSSALLRLLLRVVLPAGLGTGVQVGQCWGSGRRGW